MASQTVVVAEIQASAVVGKLAFQIAVVVDSQAFVDLEGIQAFVNQSQALAAD